MRTLLFAATAFAMLVAAVPVVPAFAAEKGAAKMEKKMQNCEEIKDKKQKDACMKEQAAAKKGKTADKPEAKKK